MSSQARGWGEHLIKVEGGKNNERFTSEEKAMKGWVTSFGSSTGCSLTALCCWGTPAIVSLLSAVGLGFMIHDAILIPLLVVFLSINLLGSYHSSKRHGRREVFPLTVISALLVVSGIWFSAVLLVIGVVGTFLASGLDLFFSKTNPKACQSSG